MRTCYVTECVFQTDDIIEMKNKILKIMTERYEAYYYDKAGISKLDIYKIRELDFYAGAWVDVYEDGKLIKSVSIEKAWEI